ncbi:MAG: T9SS type A sorting domain-containing protein, partial [Candidatus Cloacimonetes bacterium]|nr:T9SS type A sorting domain-containing protein [Candidatus Cloacimonadota bacterium]
TTCFTEAWLRATNNGNPTGAIAHYGSSINQSWSEPMRGQDHAIDLLVGWDYSNNSELEQKNSIGGIYYNGSCNMLDVYGDNGMMATWIIFGDASLQVRTDTPSAMNVSHQPTLPQFAETFDVSTGGVEGALVCLSYNNEIIGSGFTNAAGNVTLQLWDIPLPPADVTITVSAFNKITYVETIPVDAGAEPYVVISDFTYEDENGDGIIEFGETIYLTVTLENVGVEPATGISMTLSINDSYITLTDDFENIGTINAGEYVTFNNAFEFTVSTSVPNDYNFSFEAVIPANEDTWEGLMSFTAYAPVIFVGNVVVDDDNGQLDPGDTADLIVTLENAGGATAMDIIALLTNSDPYVQINTNTDDLTSLVAGSSGEVTFNVSVDEDTQIGYVAEFMLNVSAHNNYSVSDDFSLNIGICLEDFETGNFVQYPWEFEGQADWLISSDSYEGDFSAQSGDINDDQISMMSVTLDVLSNDNITFYYKVSSESNYDYLRFYIDGNLQNEWAGEVSWAQASYPVTAGNRTFTWAFEKDGSVSDGSDCGWIDYIIFPPVTLPTPPELEITPNEFNVTLEENSALTEILYLSNVGGGSVDYSINLVETTGRVAISENDYEVDVAADIAKKERIANGLEIKPAEVTTMINPAYAPDLRATNVTITCDGGSYQYEVSWEIEDTFGTVVASGGAPFSGNASLDNGIYTVYGHDSYGDGWNGNYLTVTDTDGTEYLNWTFETGYEGTTTFEINAAPPISWLTLSQTSGSIVGGDTDEISVIFDTAGHMDNGTYTAEITISSNVGEFIIPVTMIVGDDEPIVYGDVDGNGEVQAFDAAMVLQYSAEMIEFDGEQLIAADVDGNGDVQAFDAALILQYSAGIIDEFPVEGGKSANPVDAKVSIKKSGDKLHISTSDITSEKIISFQFDLHYVGEFENYKLSDIARGGEIVINDSKDGILKISYMNIHSFAGDGEFLELQFENLSEYKIDNFYFNNTKIENVKDTSPTTFTKLIGNYPNPFDNSTMISFNLATNLHEKAQIEIFNIKGQLVETLQPNETGEVKWNAKDQSSGIYFYKLTAGNYTSTKKMILMK